LRQTEGRKDELVALITSLEPSRLDALNWIRLNRDTWGIENGLHQLFIEWRACKRRPDHVTTTDFQSALSEDHHRPALRLVLSKSPNLKRLS
jgi:hypothetical protein